MILFADILLAAALTVVAPPDGTTVPTLRESQREYLSQNRERRFALMDDADARRQLAAGGATQLPLKLEWAGRTNAVYALTVCREGGERQVFAITNRTTAYLTNLEIGATYRWAVACGPAEVRATFLTEDAAPRLLRADGVLNFRDCGGWKGAGGRRVRQGMIFRSAGLRNSAHVKGGSLLGGKFEPGGDRVTASGLDTLRNEFRIRTDIELRNRREAACMTDTLLGPDVRWVHVPFAAYDFIDNPVRGREPFLKIFRTFLEPANYPVLCHCSGGRDRTGTLAFLLNGILGVDGDDLCRDWEATVFCEDSLKFGPSRLQRLLRYLDGLGGETVAAQCERYALSCGVTKDEIAKFREIMLEGGN